MFPNISFLHILSIDPNTSKRFKKSETIGAQFSIQHGFKDDGHAAWHKLIAYALYLHLLVHTSMYLCSVVQSTRAQSVSVTHTCSPTHGHVIR